MWWGEREAESKYSFFHLSSLLVASLLTWVKMCQWCACVLNLTCLYAFKCILRGKETCHSCMYTLCSLYLAMRCLSSLFDLFFFLFLFLSLLCQSPSLCSRRESLLKKLILIQTRTHTNPNTNTPKVVHIHMYNFFPNFLSVTHPAFCVQMSYLPYTLVNKWMVIFVISIVGFCFQTESEMCLQYRKVKMT